MSADTPFSLEALFAGDEARERYARDGVIFVRGALDATQQALVADAFAYSIAHPTSIAPPRADDGPFFFADNGNVANWRSEPYRRVLSETPIAAIARKLFGAKDVWFFNEQLFWKEGGHVPRTPWHQDTTYFKFDGPDQAVFWVSLDPLPEGAALEVVRGSHRQTLYDGISSGAEGGRVRFYADADLPPLPDIEGDRARWDIASWGFELGDLLIFHPKALHGGGPATPEMRRRSLTLRLCGDKTVRVERPDRHDASGTNADNHFYQQVNALQIGEPVSNTPCIVRL
jgi:ectoine hydroxylase-related dioxygenase (phytanoyl-CoA dioxygenase family)